MNGVYPIRVAVISDVHANLVALDAVIKDLRDQVRPDVIVGLGDFVFGGPQPVETVARLRELCNFAIAGNTDPWITGASAPSKKLAPMCEWAADQLGPAELEWLRSLPSQVRTPELPNLLGIHATLRSDDDTVLPTADEATFVAAFGGSDAQVITCGHIHRPYVRTTGSTTVVGVGSVGFPADRDPRACYAVLTYEDGRWTVEHRRVEYDVDSTVRFLRSSGMPQADERVRRLVDQEE